MPINPFCKTALEMCDSAHQAIINPDDMLKLYDQNKIKLLREHKKEVCIIVYRPSFYDLWKKQLKKMEPVLKMNFEHFKGDFFKTPAGKLIGICLLPIGAPAAALCLEEIGALGFRNFIEFGTCGSLHEKYAPGNLFLVDQAARDEGTSAHYMDKGFFAFANFEFSETVETALNKSGIKTERGVCWSTDGFYRETVEKYRFLADKIQIINMETSALFAVCKFRKYRITSLQFVSDILSCEHKAEWKPDFASKRIKEKAGAAVTALTDWLCR
jgi:uridine phosphorylase